MIGDTLVIAEVKLWSPWGERLTENSWREQLELANEVGDIVSILTNPIWKGSRELLARACRLSKNPVLAKDFHGTDEELNSTFDVGANFALVVGRVPGPSIDLGRCFIEPLDLAELATMPPESFAVWNSRDLSSLKDLPGIPQFLLDRWKQSTNNSSRKRETFKEAREVWAGKLCQASNLKTVADIEEGADAILVGSNLELFAASMGIHL